MAEPSPQPPGVYFSYLCIYAGVVWKGQRPEGCPEKRQETEKSWDIKIEGGILAAEGCNQRQGGLEGSWEAEERSNLRTMKNAIASKSVTLYANLLKERKRSEHLRARTLR